MLHGIFIDFCKSLADIVVKLNKSAIQFVNGLGSVKNAGRGICTGIL